ncbi:hypothetical protein Nepgr_006952 [Nepenthes gracilis]|uniref:ubiquitinyl hydrolase 1 n=1 Tax=Nepenthes gracilis TaxID=150966 RepID=A0AAD3XHT7_NEPGR|nr:hypothetical protein Nepgr_006952 [Nepenthes gracilis]
MFPAVDVDTSQSAYVFKCQSCDQTGVTPEGQKIMVKGDLLKDDADWSVVGVNEGQRLMMMEIANEIMKAPEEELVIMENLSEEEQVVAVARASSTELDKHVKASGTTTILDDDVQEASSIWLTALCCLL